MRMGKIITCVSAVACMLALCMLAACAPAASDSQGAAATVNGPLEGAALDEAIANAQPDDPYVADEVCLSCHGGTYEAVQPHRRVWRFESARRSPWERNHELRHLPHRWQHQAHR